VQGNNEQLLNGKHVSYRVSQQREVPRNPRPSVKTKGRFAGDAPTKYQPSLRNETRMTITQLGNKYTEAQINIFE
jgi:hypothetical protein